MVRRGGGVYSPTSQKSQVRPRAVEKPPPLGSLPGSAPPPRSGSSFLLTCLSFSPMLLLVGWGLAHSGVASEVGRVSWRSSSQGLGAMRRPGAREAHLPWGPPPGWTPSLLPSLPCPGPPPAELLRNTNACGESGGLCRPSYLGLCCTPTSAPQGVSTSPHAVLRSLGPFPLASSGQNSDLLPPLPAG